MSAVTEYFSVWGRCRDVQIAEGAHAPIILSVEQMDARAMLEYGHDARQLDDAGSGWARTRENAPGFRIEYRGHKDDLLALGCISAEVLAGSRYCQYHDDPRGAVLYLESKAGRGHRGRIKLVYWTQSRSFAVALPGVNAHCGDWLLELTGRPRLRLVVDNTREHSHT